MALIKCEDCGKDVSDSAPACLNCGRPTKPQRSTPEVYKPSTEFTVIKYFAGGLVVILIFAAIVKCGSDDPTTPPQQTAAVESSAPQPDVVQNAAASTLPAPPKDTSPSLPSGETEFIKAVTSAQDAAKTSQNDMQLGGIKAQRDNAICAIFSSRQVSGWVGKIHSIDSNSDGKGVLEIDVGPSIHVETENNDFSDIGDDTLIAPGTALFQAASAMKTGDLVMFDGEFIEGSDDTGACLKETSLTLNGKVTDPDFIFKFSSVKPNTTPET